MKDLGLSEAEWAVLREDVKIPVRGGNPWRGVHMRFGSGHLGDLARLIRRIEPGEFSVGETVAVDRGDKNYVFGHVQSRHGNTARIKAEDGRTLTVPIQQITHRAKGRATRRGQPVEPKAPSVRGETGRKRRAQPPGARRPRPEALAGKKKPPGARKSGEKPTLFNTRYADLPREMEKWRKERKRGRPSAYVGAGAPQKLRGRKSGGPKMTKQRRETLPKEQFGLPEQRKYPLDTPGRARNAKARATQMHKQGIISKEQRDQIHQRANVALGRGGRAPRGRPSAMARRSRSPRAKSQKQNWKAVAPAEAKTPEYVQAGIDDLDVFDQMRFDKPDGGTVFVLKREKDYLVFEEEGQPKHFGSSKAAAREVGSRVAPEQRPEGISTDELNQRLRTQAAGRPSRSPRAKGATRAPKTADQIGQAADLPKLSDSQRTYTGYGASPDRPAPASVRDIGAWERSAEKVYRKTGKDYEDWGPPEFKMAVALYKNTLKKYGPGGASPDREHPNYSPPTPLVGQPRVGVTVRTGAQGLKGRALNYLTQDMRLQIDLPELEVDLNPSGKPTVRTVSSRGRPSGLVGDNPVPEWNQERDLSNYLHGRGNVRQKLRQSYNWGHTTGPLGKRIEQTRQKAASVPEIAHFGRRPLRPVRARPSALAISNRKKINKIKRAYYDTDPDPRLSWDEISRRRNLDFEGPTFAAGSKGLPGALDAIGPYNDFDPDEVLDAIERNRDRIKSVQVGRENSPVLYLKIDGSRRGLADEFNADEVSYEDGWLRLWWD